MKKGMRWIVPMVGVIAVVVLFLVLKPGGGSGGSSATPTAAASSEASTTPTGATTATPSPEPGTAAIEVSVEGGVVDGPGELEVTRGQQVDIVVSADVSDEVHVHGYDLHGDVSPGSPASISFTADAPGVFEVELESAGLLLFQLKVTP